MTVSQLIGVLGGYPPTCGRSSCHDSLYTDVQALVEPLVKLGRKQVDDKGSIVHAFRHRFPHPLHQHAGVGIQGTAAPRSRRCLLRHPSRGFREGVEIILEQCGSLLKKRLRPFFSSHRQADRLTFKDAFRNAAKHGLITVEASERWFVYRDNRNDTAHNYGERFAETTLKLLPDFISDAKALARVIAEGDDD